ncbi:MAG: hypothetical protein AAGA60_09455 [Cyanobacteria bacterium P01_E01_bin.42]
MLVPNDIDTRILKRSQSLCDKLHANWQPDQFPFDCFIGGGAISGEVGGAVRDIDMFPVGNCIIPAPDVDLIVETRNAITYNTQPHALQVCDYRFLVIEELVQNFDFSHNQIAIGATFDRDSVEIHELHYTAQFIWAKCNNTTSYECSNYPISSLIRAAKYRERGLLKGVDYAKTVMEILADIVSLKIETLEEFSDHIRAVDLGLFEELEGSEEFNLLFLNLVKKEEQTKKC